MRIVIVSAFYSEGMGYSENGLSKALAKLGHEVHVVTSTFNVYGNEALYETTYEKFLGPRHAAVGTTEVDGYHVHRLETTLVGNYVWMKGLGRAIARIAPDVVHSLEVASLQTFALAARKPFSRYKLFCETHQTLSVVKPYLKRPGSWLKKAGFGLTRTLPSFLASIVIERCYAVTTDCVIVATRFYAVPARKVVLLSLGTDTDMFHPVENDEDVAGRHVLRTSYGFADDDIVCVYTGRFTTDKNPLVLARAIATLSEAGHRYKGIFIGDGVQRDEIAACTNCVVVPFMTHERLARHYRASDIAIWPRQESLSMLDAAASGLPLIVSSDIGEPERVAGNGRMYQENNVSSLAETLLSFSAVETRRAVGAIGRRRMEDGFSWSRFAKTVESDFVAALSPRAR